MIKNLSHREKITKVLQLTLCVSFFFSPLSLQAIFEDREASPYPLRLSAPTSSAQRLGEEEEKLIQGCSTNVKEKESTPPPPFSSNTNDPTIQKRSRRYAVYLDVWDRFIPQPKLEQ